MNWLRDIDAALKKMPFSSKNIRTMSALVKVIENIDKIEIEKLEKFLKENGI